MPNPCVKFLTFILVSFLVITVLDTGSKVMAASATPSIPFGALKIGDTPVEILKEKMSSVTKAFQYYEARLDELNRFKNEQAIKAKEAAQKLIADNKDKTCPKAKDIKDTCIQDVNNAKNLVKTDYRLAKYYEIMSGAKNMCVKADLGLQPRLIGKPYKPNKAIGNFGRLYLCSEADGKLTWRVLSDSAQGGSTMVRVIQIGASQEARGGVYIMTNPLQDYAAVATLSKEDVKKILLKNYVNKAEEKAGLPKTS